MDDNFFDLGGNPVSAVKLFDEIAKVFGRELPPLVIYHSPTIAALAALIERTALPKFSPLVPLIAGEDEPPVFVAPGLGGSVMEFSELVRTMQSRHPVYGLQSMGDNGADIPFERIEDMADYYAEAIRQRQRHGPYLLIGYSLGGLVMLEIAQCLTRMGGKIGLLTLLDTYPDPRFLKTWHRARLVIRLIRQHASILRQLPLPQAISYVLHPAQRLSSVSRDAAHKFVREPFAGPMRQVRDRAYLALARYQPRTYPGKVKFVQASTHSVFPDDPAAVWSPWMKDLEVEGVPGDHHGMLSQHFDSLAAVISRHLGEVR
jgi:thioesterase domain-containing protein